MKKIILSFAICIILFTSCTTTLNHSEYADCREQLPGAKEILPDSNYLSIAEKTQCTHETKHSLFRTETVQLILEMKENVYYTEKNRLLSNLTFQNEPPLNYFDRICITKTKFTVNGYTFYLLKTPSSEYPHQFGFAGFNDMEHKTAFLYCYDPSLDYVDSEDFVQKYYKLN